MVTIQEDYADVVKQLQEKKISNEDIDKFFVNLIEKQIKDIKEDRREDIDIGDIFPIYTIAVNKGYKLNNKLENLIIGLGDYKLKENDKYTTELNSLEDVEKALEKL